MVATNDLARVRRVLPVLALALWLMACGGSDAPATPDPPAPDTPLPPPWHDTCPAASPAAAAAPAAGTFNVEAAIEKALEQGVRFELRSTDQAVPVLLLGYAPAADGVFLGNTYRRAIRTFGAPGQTHEQTLYYKTRPTCIVGTRDAGGLETVMTHDAPLPTSAAVGQSGHWYRFRYPDTLTEISWSVEEAAVADLSWVCLATTQVSMATSRKECFLVDPAGTILGGRFVAQAGGVAGQTYESR